MKHMMRYRLVWRLTYILTSRFLKRKLRFTPVPFRVQEPILLLANHNTDYDPFLIGLSCPEYLSFVASEHIFRWGLVGRLITFLYNPIARLKGTSGENTVLTMLRRLRQGCSVALFPEGNRSFTGRTGEILPVTGKLAKRCGVPVVTYRFDGGYLTSPRWAGKHMRKGSMTGRVINIYSPEQMKAMTLEEVNEAIRRDLYVDAYEDQRKHPVAYVGKDLAVGLETVLCRCPQCGKIGTLHGVGDDLICDCGFRAHMNAYGFFEGDAPFDNLPDWDAVQTQALYDAIPTDGSALFSDTHMVLTEIFPNHKSRKLGAGTMTLYADRLEVCGLTLPVEDISGFAIIGAQRVSFSAQGRSFEITSPELRCTRKYMILIERLRREQE